MEVKKVIGIDVSKNTLDCCYLSSTGAQFIKVLNNKAGFKLLQKWLSELHVKYNEAVFCMEHTGLYNVPILQFLKGKETGIWLESAIHIKRTIGLVRGKTDKIDAERIGKYASKNLDQMRQWQPRRQVVETIKALITLRDNLITQIKQVTVPLKEYQSHGNKEIAKILSQHTRNTRKALLQEVKKIENTIKTLIQNDSKLKRIFEVLTSITGIGPVSAWLFIVYTNEFTLFDNARSLACHSGVAPFENSSGLLKGKQKVSHLANKKLKTTLHMAAMTAVKLDPELKAFYERKTITEGKNKMSVLNAVRNKLVHRIFACQKNDRCYVKSAA